MWQIENEKLKKEVGEKRKRKIKAGRVEMFNDTELMGVSSYYTV